MHKETNKFFKATSNRTSKFKRKQMINKLLLIEIHNMQIARFMNKKKALKNYHLF